MRNRLSLVTMSRRLLFALVALLVGFPVTAALGQVTFVPSDLNPGDQYHVIFQTDNGTNGESSDIADYNAFAQSQAELTGTVTEDWGVAWFAIVSTPSVDARDNIPVDAAPVYLLTDVRVADDAADLWNGVISAPVNINQDGDSEDFSDVWTGTSVDGTGRKGEEMGTGMPRSGSNIGTGPTWISANNVDASFFGPFYVVSAVLTVPGGADTQACCFPDGSCEDLSESDCQAMGGTWNPSAVCADDPCVVGACCLPGIACVVVSEVACETFGGEWQGADVPCEQNTCDLGPLGACCVFETCIELTEAACGQLGGQYKGEGTECVVGDDICTPEGACCIGLDPQTCQLLSEAECLAAKGEYKGDGTLCAEETCDDTQPRGACCIDGICIGELTLPGCLLVQGSVWLGSGTTCEDVSCPIPAACCIDGICQQISADLCEAVGGTIFEFTECYADLCDAAPAACCIYGECSLLTEYECGVSGGEFLGFSSCDDADCPGNAECAADLNGDGSVGFADLQQLLQKWGDCPAEGDCPEDINGDGSVGFGDLTQLLNRWGPCPE